MCPLLLSRKEPVLWLRAAAAFFPVKKQDVLKPHREFDLSGITALADILGNSDDPIRKGDIPKTESDHLTQPQGSPVSNGKSSHVPDVFSSDDDRHDIRFGWDFRKWVVHPAQGKVVVCERSAQDKAEIFLQGTVVDIDGPGSIAQAAVFLISFEMKKKRSKMRDICIVKTDVI